MIPQQLEIKLSIEPNLFLASIDTDLGIYLFHGQDAMAIASFVEHYIDTDIDLDNTMTAKNNRIVAQLVLELKETVGSEIDKQIKETVVVIEAARSKGLLGAEKPRSVCFVEPVNLANDLLRLVKFDKDLLNDALKEPQTLRVYIALIAVNAVNINTVAA